VQGSDGATDGLGDGLEERAGEAECPT